MLGMLPHVDGSKHHWLNDPRWHDLMARPGRRAEFRHADRAVTVGAGMTVFVPSGVAHTYTAGDIEDEGTRLEGTRSSFRTIRDTDDAEGHKAQDDGKDT
jgi:hypothetical protein